MMRARLCKPEQVEDLISLAMGRKANPMNECGIDELLFGNCYEVLDDSGKQVGAYVLQGIGREVWVQAAAGRGGGLSNQFDDLIEKHAAGFNSIAFRTYRRGLVANALKRGYEIADDKNGFILRKFLK